MKRIFLFILCIFLLTSCTGSSEYTISQYEKDTGRQLKRSKEYNDVYSGYFDTKVADFVGVLENEGKVNESDTTGMYIILYGGKVFTIDLVKKTVVMMKDYAEEYKCDAEVTLYWDNKYFSRIVEIRSESNEGGNTKDDIYEELVGQMMKSFGDAQVTKSTDGIRQLTWESDNSKYDIYQNSFGEIITVITPL